MEWPMQTEIFTNAQSQINRISRKSIVHDVRIRVRILPNIFQSPPKKFNWFKFSLKRKQISFDPAQTGLGADPAKMVPIWIWPKWFGPGMGPTYKAFACNKYNKVKIMSKTTETTSHSLCVKNQSWAYATTVQCTATNWQSLSEK